MARNIGTINTSQTFQNWFDKTNDLVEELRDNIITASSSGDSTTGDATLIGDFTSTNLIASTLLSSNEIAAVGSLINFQDPIQITGTSATTATFLYAGTGGQTRYTDGNLSWDVGLESSNPGNFIIDTGAGQTKLELSVAGTLTVPNLIVTDVISANTISLGGGGSGLNSDDIEEGTVNLYYTDARAIGAFTGGDGINIANDGTISFDGEGKLTTYEGDEFRIAGSMGAAGIKAYIDGAYLSGVGFGRLRCDWSGNTYDVLTWLPSGIDVNGYGRFEDDVRIDNGDLVVRNSSNDITAFIDNSGNGYFTGDVTTNGNASDERLKENIVPLEKGLGTVEQIKTYTFNYKDRPEDTLPGVIAQEIEQILPEVVYDIEMEDDTYKAVRYQQIVPILVNAIKELSDKVKDLENRLEKDS
jgi:hypothetical protein